MARTAIPVTIVERTGTTAPAATTGDAANDHTVAANDGRVWLEATNTSGGALTITVVSAILIDGVLGVDDVAVSVNAGATKKLGPFAPHIFNQTDGSVNIDVTSNSWNLWAFRLNAI